MTAERNPGVAAVVLFNGVVMSVDRAHAVHEAMHVHDGTIVAVGGSDEVRRGAGGDAVEIDLGGRTVLPGFIDGHAHLSPKGLVRTLPDLSSCTGVADVVEAVRRQAGGAERGSWIVMGPIGTPPLYDDVRSRLEQDRFPTRADLDEAAPHNPVYIKPADSNRPPLVAVLNSAGLDALGIGPTTASPDGITIIRDAAGQPTGVIREDDPSGLLHTPSMELSLLGGAPRFTIADRIASLPHAMDEFHAGGTTSVFEGHGVAPDNVRAFVACREAGDLTMRVNAVISPPHGQSVGDFARTLRDWGAALSGMGSGDAQLRFGGVFLWFSGNRHRADLNATAAPYTAYADGYTNAMDVDEYREKVIAAARENVRVATIADNGADLVQTLEIWEEVDRRYGLGGRRWMLQHLYDVLPEEARRIKALNVLATALPTSQFWRGGTPRTMRVPDERRHSAGAYRTMSEILELSSGTDGAPARPMVSLDAITTRRVRDGAVIGEHESLTLDQALTVLTRNGALLSFEESVKGSLEPGKFADFLVLGDDLRAAQPGAYSSIDIQATAVGGRFVHGAL